MFSYLPREEVLAVIGEPGDSWVSQRDHALFLLMYNTGARVSEIIGIKVGNVDLDASAACVHLHGKGRKQRSVPLWHPTRCSTTCESCDYEKYAMRAIANRSDLGAYFNKPLSIISDYA